MRVCITSFFLKYAERILLLGSAFFVLLCYSVTLDKKAIRTTDALPNEVPCYLVSDSVVNISLEDKPEYPINAISILFGTYARENEGVMNIRLFEDDKVMQEWEFNTSRMVDNGYQKLTLHEPYTMNKSSHYRISIVDKYKGNNAVALWQTNDGRGCCMLTYKEAYPWRSFGMFALFVLFVLGLYFSGIKEIYIMSVVLGIATFMFWRVSPLNGVPDEEAHFLRSYEVAHYSLISEHLKSTQRGGHVMYGGLRQYFDKSARINKDMVEEYEFQGAALYSPISYMPQAIGIKISGWMTTKVYKIFKGGRAANALISFVLCIFVLRLIPFGRKIFFVIMLMPITMQEMVSLAPDSVVNSLSMLWISYILNIAYTDRRITNRSMALLAIIGITLAMLKIIYVVLLLLIFILPMEKFSNKKIYYFFSGSIIAVSLVLNIIWLRISSQFLIEFNLGVDPASQIKYILEYPQNYIATILNTSMFWAEFYVKSGTGTCLGWLNISTSPYIWIVILMALTYETLCCREEIINVKVKDIILILSCCIVCSLLVYTSLYVQWTPLKNDIVNGIQGRYFIPLLAYFSISCVMIHNKRSNIHVPRPVTYKPTSYLYLIMGLSLADALICY